MSGQAARIAGAGLALLAALALAGAAVALLVRSDDSAPVQIIAAPQASPAPTARDIRVQVSGAVMSPGVYSMNDGDRVMDAIAAAGGVDPNANLTAINLARRVQDETHYHIPFIGETPPSPAQTLIKAAEDSSGIPRRQNSNGSNSGVKNLVDLNTASAQDLQSLPGIGSVLAGRIIAHREANGPFAAVSDIENVPGIGPRTLESIRALVTVSGGP